MPTQMSRTLAAFSVAAAGLGLGRMQHPHRPHLSARRPFRVSIESEQSYRHVVVDIAH
jgi:hypothetical protein